MANNINKKPSKNIIKWILAVFMFTACLAYGFCFASVIFALLGVCFLPLAPIQNFIDKILPKKKLLRGIIAFVIFVIGCNLAPQLETDTPNITVPTNSTINTEITNYTTDTTTDTTQGTESSNDQTTPPTAETTTPPTTETKIEPTASPTTQPATKLENSIFEIHFFDVGQADSALVLCDGKAMLIDGGNAGDSSLLYSYLKKNNISHLDYVIGTHAHEDHIGGLAGALNYASVGTAYCPVQSYSTKVFGNFVSALSKHGVSITVPSKGNTFSLGSATCTVLAVNTDSSDPNNTSIVLRIVYGETSFLFTGDAERIVEQAILNGNPDIRSTVLKVGHHGSDSSTSYVWLREVMPQYAVISVGKNNFYGHPTEDVLSRLRDAEVKTFRTDLQGDVVCVSDGKNVTFTVSKNANADVFGNIGGNSTQKPTSSEETPTPTEPKETQKPTEPKETEPEKVEQPAEPNNDNQFKTHYVLNTNTKKFHYEGCHSAKKISVENRQDFYGTREELIAMGYSPCGNCDP